MQAEAEVGGGAGCVGAGVGLVDGAVMGAGLAGGRCVGAVECAVVGSAAGADPAGLDGGGVVGAAGALGEADGGLDVVES
jgi:hypothetical protein